MRLTIEGNHKEEIIEAMREQIPIALEAIGSQVENYAKINCPVDTGLLRNSLTHEVSPDENCVYVGSNVEYAPYVEFGTSRQEGQPFLKPAVMDHISEYSDIVQECMNQ